MFSLKAKMKISILFQKLLTLILFPWTHCIFDKLVKHFWKQLDKILQIKYENAEKNGYFTKKNHQNGKRSSVDVNCRSDKPAGLFPPEVRQKSLKMWKSKKMVSVFSKKKYLPKVFLRTRSISTILPKGFRKDRICFYAHSAKEMRSM